jgi:hypothetical protein
MEQMSKHMEAMGPGKGMMSPDRVHHHDMDGPPPNSPPPTEPKPE